MIYFKKIRYKNILSTGNQFTEIELDKHHSTLVVGENGAGKSTMLEALSFGLYGKPFRKISKAQLVNSINNKALLVEIEFDIGSKHYMVRRGIKPNVFEIFCNNELLNLAAASKDYQEQLEKSILKLNHKSFSQIVILGNASFTPFMQLSAAHRREIIEDLLDIQIFTTMNSLLKDRVSANRSSLNEVDYKMKATGEKITMQKEHIERIKQTNQTMIDEKQGEIEQLTSQSQAEQESLAGLQKQVEDLQTQIADYDDLLDKQTELVDLERQAKQKISKLTTELSFFENHDNCPTCKQGIDHDFKHQSIEERASKKTELGTGLEKLMAKQEKLAAKLQQYADVQASIAKLNKQVTQHNTQWQMLQFRVSGLRDEIEKIRNNPSNIEAETASLKTLQQSLKECIAEKEVLAQQKLVIEIAAHILRDQGIKTKIIKQYVPIMNKLINKYLAAMDFFVNFELNESFEETIKSRFRDEFTYASFSEGEKMRIDLALLFTWRSIAKLRNSASTNLLIMDEVFDSSLDTAGTDEFLKILNTLTGDTNVFIISHKGDQLYDKFPAVLKFEKHKNFSRIALS